MIGETILHYKITEKLGEGGMGVVYKAEDTKLKREVAIKFLPRQIAASEEERERFKIEAQAAAALNHPNIATIHNIEEVDDEMFIVMEYIKGRELRELIIDNNQLSIDNVLNYATQIASGLQAAHKKGITHRDIKSSNIMITEENQVKIMDFGLAKMRGSAQLTKVGTTLGTAAYMSPEQVRGEDTDHRTDIWAFGVVLYEMLTGELPFKGDYEQAVMYSIMNEEPEPLTQFNIEIPDGWQSIIHEAFEKNKSERYQSTTDLLEDLKALAQSKTTTVAAFKGKSTKRNFVFVGVGIALLLAIIVIFSRNNTEFFGTRQIPAVDATATPWTKSIAVLPFSDLSQAKDQEYFCDGMTEQIITNLSHLQDLKVIARTSVMTFKGLNKTIPEIGKALNVSHVLEGSIRKSGNSIRVTAKLIKVDDSTNLWGHDYDRELKDIFGVQDDVSQAIVAALFEQLSPKDVLAIRTQQTENVAAYEYNLKGNYFHHSKFLSSYKVEDFEKSEQMFRKAIELEPNYALALAGLADLYDTYLRQVQDNKKYDALRQEYVEKAFQLDPNSAYVNTIKGWVHWGKGEYEHAYESMKSALEKNPNESYGNLSMALLLDHFGLQHQAITFSTRAIAVDPLFAPNYLTRGVSYGTIGNLPKASLDYQQALEIESEYLLALNRLTQQSILVNRFDEAGDLLARCEKINPDYFRNRISAAWLYAAKGEREKAVAAHEDDVVYILLGMKDEAIRQLSKQHEHGWPLGITGFRHGNYLSLRNLSIYDSLRDAPRFVEILEKEKRRYEEYLRKYGGLQSQ